MRSKFYIKNCVRCQSINVYSYNFEFLQTLNPSSNAGQIIVEKPQGKYNNKKKLAYCKGVSANTEFCRFSIKTGLKAKNIGNVPCVYLWIVNGEIIYIGETKKLKTRFNSGYGRISPRNCFVGGQSTNCKMNHAILELYRKGENVDLYYYQTSKPKIIEKELLDKIETRYNVQNN